MRCVISILLFTLFVSLADAQECSATFIKSKVDQMADDWFGLKCDPLDNQTWQEGWKTPCDCIKKGEKFTRIKSILFKKNRKKRTDLIQEMLEKKVAGVLRSQIDNGFDQALRLDALLKQNYITESDSNKEFFPANCRMSKIEEVIKKAQEVAESKPSSCDKDILKKRLSILLDGKNNFKDYFKSKNDTYGYASMNMLSAKDKKEGMCIPYKSFQSLNNKNPYQKTYITMAKIFGGDFEKFQSWVKNRSNASQDMSDIGKFLDEKKKEAADKKAKEEGRFGLIPRPGGMDRSRAPSALGSKFGDKFGSKIVRDDMLFGVVTIADGTNGFEEIDQNAIFHLLKTDPLFERMVKDKDFYKKMATTSLGVENGLFDENSKDLLKEVVRSQNKQCADLFGGVVESEQSQGGQRGQRGARPSSTVPTSTSKDVKIDNSLLSQFLCQEKFPAQFLNENTIKNVLAPEFKSEGEIKGIKHTEWIIAKWAYCGEDKINESENGEASISFDDEDKPQVKMSKEAGELTHFLDLAINPKSDLEEDNTNNEYKKFNTTVCRFLPKECTNLDKGDVSMNCSTANVAERMISNMISANRSKEEVGDLQKKIDDSKITDKQLREILKSAGKLPSEQIEAIITMRSQTVEGKFAQAQADLKKTLKLDDVDDVYAYIESQGGITKFLENHPNKELVKEQLIQRYKDVVHGYSQDTLYSEELTNKQSSFFSNYFALANSVDEQRVRSGEVLGPLSDGSANPSAGNSDVIIPSDGGINPGSTAGNSGYQRKAFWPTPDTGPVIIDPGGKKEPQPDPKPRILVDDGDTKPSTDDAKKTAPVTKAVAAALDTANEAAGGNTGAQNTGKSSDFYLSSSSDSGSGSKGNVKKESSGFTKTEDASTEELEKRLDFLKNKIKENEDSSLAGSNGPSAEVQRLRDEVATEQSRLANKRRLDSIANSSSRYSGGGSPSWAGGNGFSGDNGSAAVRNNGNYANAYDPLDRASTGRRDLKDPSNKMGSNNQAVIEEDEGAASGGAGGALGKAAKKAGATGSSLTASGEGTEGEGGGVSSGDAIKKVKGKRFPASENGESDPDDLCGDEQELTCYFEYASIDVLSPSVARFVEYLELQGRSFKAVEVFKYKNNAKPTRYFIHHFEPMENMTAEEKEALFKRSKGLLKDYKKNKKELKTIASQVVQAKKTEVTKEEVKELSKSILRVPDLNKMSERRARNQ